MRSNLPTFQSVERLAEWVFSVAKYRPLKLNLNFCERSEEVRDTLLRQFHRWPEAKVADAAKQFQTLSHVAEEQCQEQVQLYLQELRGKLVGGSNALFWLNVLQPLTHAASVPRPEAREVLMALLQESKSIDGVFEQLVTKSERVLAVLTLPLKLEPLFQGVSGLAQCGYAPAANEAMEMLTMFAEEVTAYPERKKASSFAKMATDWLMVVEEVLDVLEKSLKSRWLACERAPFEEELEEVVQGHLQTAFARLSQALAMDQLYALREMRGGEDEKKQRTMRFNLGATRKPISSDCFRLLSLVPEVQNDVEIAKPVLDELEVMRLSCSLGMLSSVNPKDFEMEMLEAREFDEDFALFLRKEVFGADEKGESEGVKALSLFGKQESVKNELETSKCWSEEMENNLKPEDQGIYCVVQKNAGTSVHGLFRKSRLRDTATYVLRFLTCLSPDMVCCLSPEDVELLEQTVASMNSNNLDAWKSFSVAFHVERQEEEKDAVVCEKLGSVLLPLKSTTQKIQLLKGSYPAVSVVEPAPATKWTEACHHRLDTAKEFATWLAAESKQRNLKLEVAVGSWPEGELKAVKELLDRSLQTCTEQSKDRAQAYIEETREELLSQMDELFDLDVLIKAKKGEEPAFKSLNAKLDPETQAALNMPLRLKNQIKAIASAYRGHLAMSGDASEEREALALFLGEFAVSDKKVFTSGDGLWGRTWKKKEHWKPATDQMKVFKLAQTDDGTFSTQELGSHRLEPDAKVLKAFAIKTHCVILVTTSPRGTLTERIDFPLERSRWGESIGKVTFTRRFGKPAWLCDFNVQERVVAFVEEAGRVILYRFNETFTSLEIFKRLELSLRTSLVLPVADVLLVDGSLYATDAHGSIQSVNLRNQQTSRAVQIVPSASPMPHNSLFAMADNMVLGFVAVRSSESPSEQSDGELFAVASEDFRDVPCFGDLLFVVDTKAKRVRVLRLAVTVRSESFRIQHSKEHSVNGTTSETDGSDTEDVEHWLRAFYHVYEKFPVRGLIRGVDDTRSTLKPLGGMDLARDLVVLSDSYTSIAEVAAQPIRSFLQELITFVPIQICRAEGNALTVMTNGKTAPIGNQAQDVQAVDIARSIRFGLLSPLLESWQGRCVVITSMGKQSTGKSYLLNHLTGSSFAIAGARCTDGAWMSIQILPKKVLLVVLDFEGLGSFERTEQEDVFLSVLNASISMFTIFRMEMRYDKEIDDLFARFQKGVALIKGDPSLFRGKLYMSVKDVNPNDQKGVLDEFLAKFQKMVGANRDSNFLLDLYSGQLDINCSPPLGTINYYQSLMHAQNFIEKSLCGVNTTGFRSGKTFLNCIRLVLAKIAILDWTSLDEGAKQFQLSEISSKLPGLLRTGCIIPQEYAAKNEDIGQYLKEDIVSAASGKVLDVDLMTMVAEYPAMADKWSALNDSMMLDELSDWEIDLGFDCCSTSDDTISQAHGAIKQLLRLFLRANTSIRGGKVSRDIVSDFDSFLAFFVRRRKARIALWAKQMLGGRVPEEWKIVEQQFLGRFQMLLTRCQSKCDECRLGCMKAAAHPGTTTHDCGGNHICAGRCEYCESSEHFGKTPSCSKEAGHEGKCECADGDHTCGQDCCMANSPNCGKKCSLKRGHTDLHKCDVPMHTCGEACSAQNCSGRCVLNVEDPHMAHKCVEVRCMHKCVMDGCNEVCGTLDHFHGQVDLAVVFSVENSDEKESSTFDAASEAPVVHMCGNGHECQALCDEAGICRVDVFLKQSSKTFTGARGSFQFTFQEMNGSRKKCAKSLPPDGGEDETIHYCDVRCPCCSYFCKKKSGHFGSHTTSHGNMRNTYFLSDAEEIDIEERKYKAGEQGIAEMCNLYCSKMGREHVHYLDCEQGSKAKCVYSGSTADQRRHCTRALEPKPEKEADEVLHEQFWKTLGWEDPCTSKMELELFGKCGYKCDAPDHDENPSHCILPAWHKPEPKPRSGFDGFTYVGGHKFECSHIASGGKMHHVFVLDCSGSMSGRPWSDLMAAWHEYVYNRVADGATLDLVSIVTFDNYAQIEYEAQNITTMTQADIRYRGGGTNYAAGLRSASEVLSRVNFDVYKPVVVFFSDGHPFDPLQGEQLARHIRGCYEKNGLQAFAVGFGSINLSILERVAEKLGGTYHHVLTGNELKATFFSISASLSTRAGLALTKPDHERNCVICGQDLASGETIKLSACSHELHTGCLDVLVRNAEQDGELARCPSCRCEVST
uniref:VWFA domain-containing protein n=1 Tax=Phytophthora ramorum TaxID=164328 RepID=H3HDL8_PHYRM